MAVARHLPDTRMTTPHRYRAAARAPAAVLLAAAAVVAAGCERPRATPDGPAAGTQGPVGADGAGAATPGPSANAAVAALGDRAWQLVEIQSMDDAQGTLRPDGPSKYVMRLAADGTVSMRLNCNSATGSWSAEPSADPANGRFEFGPLAATAAACPPPSLDERVSGQAQYVRGYLLKDGRLYLSLMADGGILVWAPHAD